MWWRPAVWVFPTYMPGFWRMWAASLRVLRLSSVYSAGGVSAVSVLMMSLRNRGNPGVVLQVFDVVPHVVRGVHAVKDFECGDQVADRVFFRRRPGDPRVRRARRVEGEVVGVERYDDPAGGSSEGELIRVLAPAAPGALSGQYVDAQAF